MTDVASIRLTPGEKVMAEKLAKYLHTLGKVDKPSISNAMRLSLRFTVAQILKGIEADRYRG